MPTQQVSEAKIADTFAWKVNLSFKVPTTSDSAILIYSTSPLSSVTLTNKFYGVGSHITPGVKVVKKFYKGTNTISHTIFGLQANTTYYLAFYTFNNNGNGIFYNQTNPTSLSFKTKGRTIGNYYANLDTNKAIFLTKLSELLRNHNFASYDDFDRDIINELYEQDTFINNISQKFVTCEYSNVKAYYTGNFTFLNTNFNREHTLPKNWMNFRGISNNQLVDFPEGADYHNLTLTDGSTNSLRSDFVFKAPTKNIKTIGNARYSVNTGNYNDTNNCFEPQASYRGNAARCIFYMQVCYAGQDNNKWGFKNGLKSFAINQNQELLKTWARTDLVDNFEIARNECIAFYQKSRNPFIDFPDWVDCFDFNDLRQLKTCEGLTIKNSIAENKNSDWDVWYYKTEEGKYCIKLYHDKISNIEIGVYDLNGKQIISEKSRINEGENALPLNLTGISKGQYILNIKSTERVKSFKLLLD
jgi:endonuclease I